jgi:glycosyltransferase involved in cell wall biosynthesis
MKVAYVSPLPPVRSGIAHYSALLLPALAARFDVVAVVDQEEVAPLPVTVIRADEYERRAGELDAVICQLGNNPHHELSWRVANRGGAIVVLHDIVMHHLLVEMTLAHGDAGALDRALGSMYGEAGRAIAAARAHGIHDDLPNFLYPASEGVARGARHVIVHNRWAAERLRANGVTVPITVAPLPYPGLPALDPAAREKARHDLGFLPGHRVIGVFGFVTHAKRPDVILRAFALAAGKRGDLRLLFVGEPAHNVDLEALARSEQIERTSWAATGFVPDEQFERYLGAVDRVVNLRYPSAGESSGPLFHAFAAGKPTAVSDYAQFADFPEGVVTRIPFDGEVDALVRFMLDDLDTAEIARMQKDWLAQSGTFDRAVEVYADALEGRIGARNGAAPRVLSTIPLFPALSGELESVARSTGATSLRLRVTNHGDTTIRALVWGEPPFVLFARAIGRGGLDATVPASLPCDLAPGASAAIEVAFDIVPVPFRLELRHGLGGVPDVERAPFFIAEVDA